MSTSLSPGNTTPSPGVIGASPSLHCLPAPSILDQNLTHELRRNTKEVGAGVKVSGPLFHELEIGFVHERSALQIVAGALVQKVALGDIPELAIDHWHKRLESLLIPCFPPFPAVR